MPELIQATLAQVAAARLRLKLDRDRGVPLDPAWEAVANAQPVTSVGKPSPSENTHGVELGDLRQRYAEAAQQLGHDRAIVRQAGVYAMAQLADDWGDIDSAQRQVCIDVLCAYFRMPYDAERAEPGEEQVRLAVISVIRQHLQDPRSPNAWCKANLDFTGAIFNGDEHFDGATFSGNMVSFDTVRFAGGKVSFDFTRFSGGKVSFHAAEFSGGRINFHGATFSGAKVNFAATRFSGAEVAFNGARFAGEVSFRGAEFLAGGVSFDFANFLDGYVTFADTKFSGGVVSFNDAQFSGGTVSFDDAEFSGGELDLGGAHIWSNLPLGLPDLPPAGLTLPFPPRATWPTKKDGPESRA
jgi:uncharacterized protein YjbI with pentapeptide repeats